VYPALVLVGAIAFEFMVAGEDICLDRHPWWGPPEIVTHGGVRRRRVRAARGLEASFLINLG
jgi:hypothetical protein